MAIIRFKDVWEMYQIKFIIEGKAAWDNFWAIRGIDFSVEKGEVVGIIGENGSGKTTILKLIAGMLKADRGEIEVSGRVSGLLELGAGFEPELTGRENIILQSDLFGRHDGGANNRHQDIIDFAEIGKFIDAPVKCYSQGMFVRLAFAIAVHMDPEIFLIDDTLAVGDEYFQKKCIKEIFKLKEKGKTIIIVTHDMGMLLKLCPRALLLRKGAVVKDGPTEKVVPLYSETVGSPKGMAIVEREELDLIFNNGRLLLNWKGKLITPNSGIYASFGIADKWYNSTQAEWEVSDSAGDIIATGNFYQLGLTQIWRIQVSDKHEIRWDIEIQAEKGLQLPAVYAGVTLTDKYTEWFVDTERGDFPAIKEEDKNCQTVFFKNGSNFCLGVYPQASASEELPSLIFEQLRLGYPAQASVLNSEYFNSSRILQYKTIPISRNGANQANRYICFAGKIIVNNPDINGYVSKVQNEFIISNGRLKLIFDNGKLGIFFDGLPLTKENQVFSAFLTRQRWFTSDAARWTLEKDSGRKLVARGSWDDLGISQIWRINIGDDLSFAWDVAMEIKQGAEITQQRLSCAFSEDYKHFFSEYANEKFSDTFNDTEVDLLQRCIPRGKVSLQDPRGKLPSVSLFFSEGLNNFVKIFNSNHYLKARVLHLERVEPEVKAVFQPGTYECFSARFVVGKNETVSCEGSNNVLESRNLRFIFNKGSARVYINGNEITKNIGLYASLRSGSRWYDSASGALWKIIHRNDSRIRAIGKWLDLPLSQEWDFTIKDGRIEWLARMQVDQELVVDRLQANAMFSERFSCWQGGKEEGNFPEFAADIDDDWDCIWRSKRDDRSVGLKENVIYNLPRVSFAPQELNPQWELKIINSDQYHRGRVLQYSTSLKTILLPGSYPYFSGILTIEGK